VHIVTPIIQWRPTTWICRKPTFVGLIKLATVANFNLYLCHYTKQIGQYDATPTQIANFSSRLLTEGIAVTGQEAVKVWLEYKMTR